MKMRCGRLHGCGLLLGVALLAGMLAGPAAARDRTDIVIGDDGDRIRIDVNDDLLTIATSDDADETVFTLDLAELNDLIRDTVDECLTTLQESQLDLRLGRDNRLQVAMDDTEFELDLDEIINQAASAATAVCSEFDADRWVDRHARYADDVDDATDAELRHEIENLRREIRRLQRDLKRVRESRTR